MKPSERIEDIVRKKGDVTFFQDFMPNPEVKAILQYLDEEWEKENAPCVHQRNTSTETPGAYKCLDCGKIH